MPWADAGRAVIGPRLVGEDGAIQRSAGLVPRPDDLLLRGLGVQRASRAISRVPILGRVLGRPRIAREYDQATSQQRRSTSRWCRVRVSPSDARPLRSWRFRRPLLHVLRGRRSVSTSDPRRLAGPLCTRCGCRPYRRRSSSGDYRFGPWHAASMIRYLRDWHGAAGVSIGLMILALRAIGHVVTLRPNAGPLWPHFGLGYCRPASDRDANRRRGPVARRRGAASRVSRGHPRPRPCRRAGSTWSSAHQGTRRSRSHDRPGHETSGARQREPGRRPRIGVERGPGRTRSRDRGRRHGRRAVADRPGLPGAQRDRTRRNRRAVVGGSMQPTGTSPMGEAIAAALSSPVGVGDSSFHFEGEARDVDSVYLGVYRRTVLDAVGLVRPATAPDRGRRHERPHPRDRRPDPAGPVHPVDLHRSPDAGSPLPPVPRLRVLEGCARSEAPGRDPRAAPGPGDLRAGIGPRGRLTGRLARGAAPPDRPVPGRPTLVGLAMVKLPLQSRLLFPLAAAAMHLGYGIGTGRRSCRGGGGDDR